jgi:hypothetical protein
MKRCEYNEDKRCRKTGYYGINGKRYCYEHKRLIEIAHFESIRR